MKNSRLAISTAVGSLLAFGAATTALTANAAEMEKCWGIAKAGKNDCQTNTSACAGTSTADNQPDAWIFVPEGVCDKIVGGSTEPLA